MKKQNFKRKKSNASKKKRNYLKFKKISFVQNCKHQKNFTKMLGGLNGGYYSGGLQQAHSTTPLEAPHSAGPHVPPSVSTPQSAVPASASVAAAGAQPPSIQHSMLNKSVNSSAPSPTNND